MKTKRDNVYVWITWLTKLIAGENQCEFQAWFKSHYKHEKVEKGGGGGFNLTKWTVAHNELVHACRDELEAKGYKVTIEDQNSFRLRIPGNKTVSGKADIVAIDGNKALVVDCKTGRAKNSDHVQVMLYMILLPKCIERYKDVVFEGRVLYNNNEEVPISSSDIDQNLLDVVQKLIDKVCGDKPLRKVPSYNECRWCDISKDDCPERVE